MYVLYIHICERFYIDVDAITKNKQTITFPYIQSPIYYFSPPIFLQVQILQNNSLQSLSLYPELLYIFPAT